MQGSPSYLHCNLMIGIVHCTQTESQNFNTITLTCNVIMMMDSLPKYCVRRNNTIELRVGSIAVLDTAIIGCGIVNHHHHCSTHWRVRGCECHSSAVDASSIDTGSTVGIIIETIIHD